MANARARTCTFCLQMPQDTNTNIYKLQNVKGLERKLEAYVILPLAIIRCKYNGVVCVSC